jgi:hypothetical protein
VRGLQIALNLYKDTGDLFASKVPIRISSHTTRHDTTRRGRTRTRTRTRHPGSQWSQATETEIRLLLVQKELESETGELDFVGGSLTDTLFRLIASRNLKRAQKIKSDFKARFLAVKVAARCAQS